MIRVFFASNGNSEKILFPRWGSEKNCESQDGNFEAFKAHGAEKLFVIGNEFVILDYL